MKKDTINLVDTFKIFKKNLKTFYIFIFSGLIFGLLGAVINTNYIEARSDLTIEVSIKNPLKNYFVLDLFTLDTIEILDNGNIAVSSTSKRIENYNLVASQYLDLIAQNIDLKEYINNEEDDYKFTYKLEKFSCFIEVKNVVNSDEIKKNLSNLSEDLNSLVSPIILNNLKKETENLKNFLVSIENKMYTPDLETLIEVETLIKLRNQNTQKETGQIENFKETIINNPNIHHLKTLIKIRQDVLKRIENRKIEIFETIITETKTKISNGQIVILFILLSLSMFLLLIILRR